MSDQLERRTFNFELRAEGDSPKIVGHAALFNTEADLGSFRESIAPGAFAKAIQDDDVRALFNHDPNFVLGRNRAGTLRMSEDDKGLAVEIDPPATQWARDLQVSMKRGDISQMSFGFVAKEQRVEKRDGVLYRLITRAQLFDVSPVTYPAYKQTDVAVRSAQDILAELEAETRSEEKTKRVDGEDLTAADFLIVGDKNDSSTWKLPWKFSTEEKTKAHLRNALARFDQLAGVSEDEKKAAYAKLIRLCKEYGIEVSEKDSHHDIPVEQRDAATEPVPSEPIPATQPEPEPSVDIESILDVRRKRLQLIG